MSGELDSEALSVLPRGALEDILEEHEQIVIEIRKELKRRREDRQHAEIEKLDKHAENARIKFEDLKAFLLEVLAELRGEKNSS